MACYSTDDGCPFVAEGIPMDCRDCPYSDGECDEE